MDRKHLHQKPKHIQCKWCPMKFDKMSGYKQHELSHTGQRDHQCKYCDKKFKLYTHMTRHVRLSIFIVRLLAVKYATSILVDRTIAISIIKVFFSKNFSPVFSNLPPHRHSKPYKCELCTASFAHKQDLQRHELNTHLTARKYKCHICGKAFAISKTLNRHLDSHVSAESGGKNFPCFFCDKSFNRRDNCNVHMRSVPRQNHTPPRLQRWPRIHLRR